MGTDLLDNIRTKVIYKWLEEGGELEYGPKVDELDLNENLKLSLKLSGIERLYKFQELALEKIRRKFNTVIVAGTGTGKTEAFLIPILDEIINDPVPGINALILYPTKALTSDQYSRINRYTSKILGMSVAIYDGDTERKEREKIFRNPPKILLSNPDMLHLSLMNPNFRSMIKNLKFVVLDDMHVYHGVFGTHVAYLFRRLKRVLKNKPVLIGCTATITSPDKFAESIFGEDVVVIEGYKGRRSPVLHVMVHSERYPRHVEVLRIAKNLMEMGLKTLIFADSHRSAELLALMAKRYGLSLSVHRAGLLKEERRKIERLFKTGSIKGIVSTPTLELGIDIGDLDVVILDGMPPTYTRYLQRVGRCGRRGSMGYAFMVLSDDPISNYYISRPIEYYSQSPDELPLDLTNEEVAKKQLLAMATDKPISDHELDSFLQALIKELLSKNLLVKRGKRYYVGVLGRRIAKKGGIRSIGERVIILDENNKEIGWREVPIALRELHPGAIYFHGGRIYEVLDLDISRVPYRATVRELPRDYNFYTMPLYSALPSSFERLNDSKLYSQTIYYGRLSISIEVYGYVKKRLWSNELIGEYYLENPVSYTFLTKGLYFKFPEVVEWRELENAEAFHAIEHIMISASEMIVGAGLADLGGISFPDGTIIIYDSAPGGSGVSKLILKRIMEVFNRAFTIVSECSCEDGCPKCIYSPYCGNNNKILSRQRAVFVMNMIKSGIEIPIQPSIRIYGRPLV